MVFFFDTTAKKINTFTFGLLLFILLFIFFKSTDNSETLVMIGGGIVGILIIYIAITLLLIDCPPNPGRWVRWVVPCSPVSKIISLLLLAPLIYMVFYFFIFDLDVIDLIRLFIKNIMEPMGAPPTDAAADRRSR